MILFLWRIILMIWVWIYWIIVKKWKGIVDVVCPTFTLFYFSFFSLLMFFLIFLKTIKMLIFTLHPLSPITKNSHICVEFDEFEVYFDELWLISSVYWSFILKEKKWNWYKERIRENKSKKIIGGYTWSYYHRK